MPTMHSTQGLYDELTRTLFEVNRQIDEIKKNAEKMIEARPYPELYSVYTEQYTNGHYVLTDLLVAKAQLLSSMATLKASMVKR